ncbi:hypothetical protein D2Q93_02800 [Alicyclobacillaceae bacterium I2511]|nr:hypothetical protein D2Q93_02800 [Alicyclobacillaceae bacterium I2511]
MMSTNQKTVILRSTSFILVSFVWSMSFLAGHALAAVDLRDNTSSLHRVPTVENNSSFAITKIAFIRDRNLWVHWSVDPSFSNERQLTFSHPVKSPKWSADGRWIAYVTTGEDPQGQVQTELRVYDVSADRDLPVVQFANTYTPLQYAWSPKGTCIAVGANENLRLYQVTDKQALTLSPPLAGVHGFVWNQDGKTLTVATWSTKRGPEGQPKMQLKILSLENNFKSLPKKPWISLPTPLQVGPLRLWPQELVEGQWSNDGRWLALSLAPGPQWATQTGLICVVDSKMKAIQSLSEILPQAGWMTWSPNSQALAWTAGGGTNLNHNKSLTWAQSPYFRPQSTQSGGSDGGLTWLHVHSLAIARQTDVTLQSSPYATSASVQHTPAHRPMRHASLYELSIESEKSTHVLTTPPPGCSDEWPMWLSGIQKLAWLRESPTEATLYLEDLQFQSTHPWVQHVDLPQDERHGNTSLSVYCIQ